MREQKLHISHLARYPGKRALAWHGGVLYASGGYTLWRRDPKDGRWSRVARYRPGLARTLSSVTRLGGRLRRDGFHALEVLPDGSMVAVLAKAIAVCSPGGSKFEATWHINRGTRPLALASTPQGTVYWGEYFSNPDRDQVHVYGSSDGGRSWDVAHTFPRGSIRHVHSITYDPFRDHLWLCTGDYGAESRIIAVSNDFRRLDTVLEGDQQTRAVRPVVAHDGLYFATDSELEQNYIYRLTPGGDLTRLCPINGPGMWGCRVGSALFFSSDVEPSSVNLDPNAAVYGSADGESWETLVSWRKDPWHMRLFQYGNIILPRGHNDTAILAATGMAVRGEDDVMHLWRVE